MLHRGVKARFDCSKRHIQYLGNILIRKVVEVTQQQNHPQTLGHLVHDILYGLTGLKVQLSFVRGRNI